MKPSRALTAALAVAPLCVLLAPATVLAAGKDPYGEHQALNLPSDAGPRTADVGGGGAGSLARTFVGLAIVVAVIYGLTWVLRQAKKRSQQADTVGFGLSTEASMSLGPNRSVHLIRAGRELVLVGSAEQGIVPIRTYSEDEARTLGLIAQPALDDLDGDGPGLASGSGTAVAVVRAKRTIGELVESLRQRTAR